MGFENDKKKSATFTLHFATINTASYVEFGHRQTPFTLHFATINTGSSGFLLCDFALFTLHFATINTIKIYENNAKEHPFTLHFATINTLLITFGNTTLANLHYTLLLLIHGKVIAIFSEEKNLHYTLLLLILQSCCFSSNFPSIYITLCYY